MLLCSGRKCKINLIVRLLGLVGLQRIVSYRIKRERFICQVNQYSIKRTQHKVAGFQRSICICLSMLAACDNQNQK